MNNLTRKKKALRSKKGFTLIELIVVIVILGILAAIIVPRLTGFTARAEESACFANLRTIETAAAVYEAENGTTPSGIAALSTYLNDVTPVCPSTPAGTYSLSNGVASCTVHTR